MRNYARRRTTKTRRKAPRKYAKRPTVATLSRKVRTIQKAIEYKHADFSTAVTVDTAGSFHDLTAIPQGDADVQRDGDKLTISSIMIRGEISAGDIPYNNLRIVFFQFERASQLPDINTIFQTTAFPSRPHLWFYNIDQFRMRKGMKIISDRVYKTRSYDGTNIQSVTFYKKIKKRVNVQYFNQTTISGQQIYMLCLSDSFLGPHPTLNLHTRINYCDL